MAINYKGKEYTPEEILKLPETEKKKIVNAMQAEMNSQPNPIEGEEILINDDYLQEEEEIPVVEVHEIKNPKAARMYEQLLATGLSHTEALMRVTYAFNIDDAEDIDDPTWKKFSEQLEQRNDYPIGLKWKILSYAVTRGVDLNTAISEVSINGTRYQPSKGTKPAEESPEQVKERHYQEYRKRHGLDKRYDRRKRGED